MPGFTPKTVTAGGVTLRYREAGEGALLLVVSGEAGRDAVPCPDAIAQSRRVLAVALADLAPAGRSARAQAAGLAQALAVLGLGPVPVLASSAGCAVALWLAATAPERVAALVLESPIVRLADLVALDVLSPAEIFAACHAHPERKPWLAGHDPVAAATALSRARAPIDGADDAALAAALKKLQIPVLALYGTRDRVTPPELGRFYKEHLVNAWFLMVYDAGHDIAGDRPEAFADVVGDFLMRGARFAFGNQSSRINP